jgi:hypothetical protein
MRAILAALVLCATAPAADAKCAMMGLEPSVLTPSGATIAPDGGIVVGVDDVQGDRATPGDPAKQPGWRIKFGSRVASPTLVQLAPGLVLYKLPADAKDGTLIDDKRATVGTVTVGAKLPALGAPKVAKIDFEAALGRKPYTYVTVELSSPAPDGTVALVLADAKGTPRSWGVAKAGDKSVRAFDQRRCRIKANGTVESKPGDKLTAFWVDASGRTSPLSAAVAVAGTKPVETD